VQTNINCGYPYTANNSDYTRLASKNWKRCGLFEGSITKFAGPNDRNKDKNLLRIGNILMEICAGNGSKNNHERYHNNHYSLFENTTFRRLSSVSVFKFF
jgi:hypothetical protein